MSENYFSRKEKILSGSNLKPLSRQEMFMSQSSEKEETIIDMENIFEAAQDAFTTLVTACVQGADGRGRVYSSSLGARTGGEVELLSDEDEAKLEKCLEEHLPFKCLLGGFVQTPTSYGLFDDEHWIIQFTAPDFLTNDIWLGLGYEIRHLSGIISVVLTAHQLQEVT